jgi:hypothetical protein
VTGWHKVRGDEAADFQTRTFRLMTILTEQQRVHVCAVPMARFMRAGF